MQITTFSDYCLRILIFLAVNDSGYTPARRIAEQYGVSVDHIAKAAKKLTRLGYVTASKGKGGGLRLAQPAEAINIGAVIRKTETNLGLVECMRKNGQCVIDGACGLAGILDEAQDAFFSVLDGYTLANTIRKRRNIAYLLKMTGS